MPALLELSAVSVHAPGGRPLFDRLDLRIEREHVALVGRNGVGKSTLLAVLAGIAEPDAGRVLARGQRHFVPQADERTQPLSLGELRRAALDHARDSGAEIVLLDEPSEHLDDRAVAWLRAWLGDWHGCLIVASHDRRLLADFRHFFVVSESGCRYFSGTLAELDAELEREHRAKRAALRAEPASLGRRRRAHAARRATKGPKEALTDARSELDRANPRILLNQKRDHAQVSHGRLAKLREARLASLREFDAIEPARAERQPVTRAARTDLAR